MFIITTATGKQFDSNYAVSSPNNDGAFVTIVGSDFSTVARTFSDPAEMPLDLFQQYHTVAGITSQISGIQLTLKP